MIKVLLIEDEVHKQEELTACLEKFFGGDSHLEHVDSVHAAVAAVSAYTFDLIVLDMALPTFSTDGGATERGHDQALGGVEILRSLKSQGVTSSVIIITQYPDITVGGRKLKLNAAAQALSDRYGQNVIGGVLYKYKSPSNANRLISLLRRLP